MSVIRDEILNYISNIPDSKLTALKPILTLLADETIVVDTNLTDKEKDLILQGREEYRLVPFVHLSEIQ